MLIITIVTLFTNQIVNSYIKISMFMLFFNKASISAKVKYFFFNCQVLQNLIFAILLFFMWMVVRVDRHLTFIECL